jgi:hypothetical protein
VVWSNTVTIRNSTYEIFIQANYPRYADVRAVDKRKRIKYPEDGEKSPIYAPSIETEAVS